MTAAAVVRPAHGERLAAWEGDLDRAKAHRILNGEIDPLIDPLRETLQAAPDAADAPVAGLQTL